MTERAAEVARLLLGKECAVKRAKPNDKKAVLEISRTGFCFSNMDYNTIDWLVRSPDCLTFMLEVEGKPAAYIAGGPAQAFDTVWGADDKTFYLSYCATIPELRRKGMFKVLSGLFSAAAREKGYGRIWVHSVAGSIAEQVHKSCGYHMKYYIFGYYGGSLDAVLLEKSLDAKKHLRQQTGGAAC
jgi:hypothetical protein